MKTITSLHWGYSVGGVGKYASIIERVGEYSDLHIHSIVVLSSGAQVDEKTMKSLNDLDIITLKSKLDISWLWRLPALIKSRNPSLVMTHGFNGHFLMLTTRYLAGVRVPLVCSYHGVYHATSLGRNILGYFYDRLTEFYFRHCIKGAIVVAEICRDYLLSKGVASDKIEVIHNGIRILERPPHNRQALRSQWHVSDDEILLGTISRLDPVKGIDYLLTAFINICKSFPKAKLVIIGTGTLDEHLKNRVHAENLGQRVIFTGFRSDMEDCFDAIDIFVLPSLSESHSIALLEAMRAHKAIIVTDVGGNTESVRHESEALVVPAAKNIELEVAIARMLEDRTLRERLAEAAYLTFLNEFTEDITVKKTALWLSQFA